MITWLPGFLDQIQVTAATGLLTANGGDICGSVVVVSLLTGWLMMAQLA